MVVGDPIEFLRARGHDTDSLTDYEIADTFHEAFKNWEHEMIEQAFFMGLASVWKPREWKTYCDDMHRLVENAGKNRNGNNTQAGAQLLSMFKSLGIPVASRATQTHGLNADGKQRR